jgi:hypothetical protein
MVLLILSFMAEMTGMHHHTWHFSVEMGGSHKFLPGAGVEPQSAQSQSPK